MLTPKAEQKKIMEINEKPISTVMKSYWVLELLGFWMTLRKCLNYYQTSIKFIIIIYINKNQKKVIEVKL